MQYIDSGTREASQAMGTWLQHVLHPDVTEIRWQSGFFSADSLGIFQEALQRLSRDNGTVHALIGSNDQRTARQDVEALANLLGVPREQAQLGVVSYSDGYFHPKVFHLRRQDGSQAAYVGSANLTGSGIASLHVEAGVTIDSREDDPEDLLNGIASAIDLWFNTNPVGLYGVSSHADIDRLVDEGVLCDCPPPRQAVSRSPQVGGAVTSPQARLRPLIRIPRLQTAPAVLQATQHLSILRPTVPMPEFPPYILFAPGQNTPTYGDTALSGSSLPVGVSGLIIRLNRDNARHFEGRAGTANLSVPVPTLFTFRFGRYVGGYPRPRAEFALRARYIASDITISVDPVDTNIMAYGYIQGETGHKDIRMIFPRNVKVLAKRIRDASRYLPQEGDVALLEWPNFNSAREFRLTFLERGSELFHQASILFNNALDSGITVGSGACWLPINFSPEWQQIED